MNEIIDINKNLGKNNDRIFVYERMNKMKFYKKNFGITLIALVVTIIVPYDKNMKRFNIKGFLYFGYIRRWVKSLSFFNS